MKIVMTLLVRDEEDVLEEHLRFHLSRGVDFVIAMDNCSVDATPQMLRAYERAGLLHYLFQPEDNFAQAAWVTQMARLACTQFGADWVINSDADEFWWDEAGDLRKTLAGAPPAVEALAVERANFVPRPPRPGCRFFEEMPVREVRSCNALGRPLPPKVCHRAFADIVVEPGNHGASRGNRPLRTAPTEMTIFHFPLRSYDQFRNKIVHGGAALERNADLDPHTGATWRRLYEIFRQGQLPGYYAAQVPSDASLAGALEDGEFVVDGRLALALAALGSDSIEPSSDSGRKTA